MTLASQEEEIREALISALVPLFAKHGYEGSSMDHIAAAIGIRIEDLQHYFPEQGEFHLAVVRFALRNFTAAATMALREPKPPLSRLSNFCDTMIRAFTDDPRLWRLLQHERLTNDPEFAKLLYEEVFSTSFTALVDTVREMEPRYDPLLLSISVVSLISLHLELRQLQRVLPGWRSEHQWPETLSLHVTSLLEAILCK